MPESVREYSYTLKPEGADARRLAAQARKVMGWAAAGDKRITEVHVDGDAFGVIQLSFRIKARDQWYSRQLAQDLLNMVSWGLQNPAGVELASTRLPAHERRGYAWGRTKRWREQQLA